MGNTRRVGRTDERDASRVAAVTGATGAIGRAIAQRLAANRGYEVVLLGRHETHARRAVDEITRATGNERVRYELVDVSRQTSVQALAQRWHGPLHVLVNNAAVAPRQREETSEGIELQFATNVLGYFWMTRAFGDHLTQSAHARVVMVASYWAGDLDLADLEFIRRPYSNGQAYRQSKQANRMLAVAFADRLQRHGVSVNACHPGEVNSRLSNSLGFGGHETPAVGAETPVWLATHPLGQQQTGKYFERMRAVSCRFGQDSQAVEALYQACVSY